MLRKTRLFLKGDTENHQAFFSSSLSTWFVESFLPSRDDTIVLVYAYLALTTDSKGTETLDMVIRSLALQARVAFPRDMVRSRKKFVLLEAQKLR
jgi:hypothetical protein